MSFADRFFSTPAMLEVVGDTNHLRQMVRFERALARAAAAAGAIPAAAGAAIDAVLARFAVPQGDDAARLFDEAANAGTLAIPFVKALTAAVTAEAPDAAAYVHRGATSQDVIDTAFVLQLRQAEALLDADLLRLCAAAARLADTHRATPVLARTLLQPALPTTFGAKAANWLVAAIEARNRLRHAGAAALVPQFGGAAGTLASLGPHAMAVAAALGRELPDLATPATLLPWHTRRGNLCALCAEVAIIAGLCGKIGRDIALMMQWEVSEAFEPAAAGRGGSSAMPHKRNPVLALRALSAAGQAPMVLATIMGGLVGEHERALGPWQSEWAAIPMLYRLAGGALAAMAEALEGLQVDGGRMRQNLESLLGLSAAESVANALAPTLGRSEAHALVEAASRAAVSGRRALSDVLAADRAVTAVLPPERLAALADPTNGLGAAEAFVASALTLWAAAER